MWLTGTVPISVDIVWSEKVQQPSSGDYHCHGYRGYISLLSLPTLSADTSREIASTPLRWISREHFLFSRKMFTSWSLLVLTSVQPLYSSHYGARRGMRERRGPPPIRGSMFWVLSITLQWQNWRGNNLVKNLNYFPQLNISHVKNKQVWRVLYFLFGFCILIQIYYTTYWNYRWRTE